MATRIAITSDEAYLRKQANATTQAEPTPHGTLANERPGARRWRRIRAWVLSLTPLCVRCLKAGHVEPATEVDHIVPLHKGGSNEADNLQALCHNCHAEKTAEDKGGTLKRATGLDGYPIEG